MWCYKSHLSSNRPTKISPTKHDVSLFVVVDIVH